MTLLCGVLFMAFCLLLIGFQSFCFALCLFLLTFILLLNSWFFFQLFYITENVDRNCWNLNKICLPLQLIYFFVAMAAPPRDV